MGNAEGGPHRGGCELFAPGQSETDGKVGVDRDIDVIPQMCVRDCRRTVSSF